MKFVDITLFVQAIHFFVAYYVLRTYVFAPSAHILEEQERDDQRLQESIDAAIKNQNEMNIDKELRLQEIKKRLRDLIPPMLVVSVRSESYSYKVKDNPDILLSEQDSKKIKTMISERLVKVSK